jgi:hypothetical protein
MKLLIMKFSPTSCHFLSLRFKYSHQHPVLKHPQLMQIILIRNCTRWTACVVVHASDMLIRIL